MCKIGIIGFGNMGSAIAERIKTTYEVFIFDKDENKTKGICGLNISESAQGLVKDSDVIILAVKPQDFDAVLNELKDYAKDKLIISIAAGIQMSYIEKYLGNAKVIRVMPNFPAKIGMGMICLCKGRFSGTEDLQFTKKLFGRLGKTLIINEDMMDVATAVSGSGPAYICEFLESRKEKQAFLNDFQKAAEDIGFNTKEAALLVNTTFSGTIDFIKKTNLSPSELKKQVASKGGTTEAALNVLHNGGSLVDAVKAAVKRAEELSRR